MQTPSIDAWLELFMMPAKLQAAMIGAMMNSTVEVSTSVTFGAPRRRSTAQLTLVSSNPWVRKHKSTAKLSVVHH
jgi:hypothetical protein